MAVKVFPPSMPPQQTTTTTDTIKQPPQPLVDNVSSNHVTKSLLYGFMTLVFIHTVAFAVEYTYQRYCYPITYWGYFTSFLTANSTTCVAVKNVVTNLSGFISNYFLQSTGLFILLCKKVISYN